MNFPKSVTAFLLLFLCLQVQAQKGLPEGYFGGLSMHTAAPLGNADSIRASLHAVKAQGISMLRLELKDSSSIQQARLDSLIHLAGEQGFALFLAIPDTTLLQIGADGLKAHLPAASPNPLKALVVAYTEVVADDALHALLQPLSASMPDISVGVSVSHINRQCQASALRWPFVDFIGLDLGYRQQRWASRNSVREAMGHVFTRLPQILDEISRAVELTGQPVVVDYLDYPRDRAFHYATSPAQIRNNILFFVKGQLESRGAPFRGLFLGEFVGDPASAERQPTETVYATDTETLEILTGKTRPVVQ